MHTLRLPPRARQRKSCYDMGHMPPGQPPAPQTGPASQDSQAEPLEVFACPTAKPDRSFFVSLLPHLAQICLALLRLFWSTSITCPHSSHRYSKIGMDRSILFQHSFDGRATRSDANASPAPCIRRRFASWPFRNRSERAPPRCESEPGGPARNRGAWPGPHTWGATGRRCRAGTR